MPTPPPNEDAFRALAADPERGPIVMLNLLKFEGTLAPAGPFASPSGRDSYMRYAGGRASTWRSAAAASSGRAVCARR
jgi:hypothetical protein